MKGFTLFFYWGWLLQALGLAALIFALSLEAKIFAFFPLLSMSFNSSFSAIFLFDCISMSFLGVLFLMCGSVFVFSETYMANDPYYRRFFLLISLFVVSMMFLIISPSFFWMILGWDGLGVTSYFLIAYYSAKSSFSASMKTFLMNRLGDGLLIISLGLITQKKSFFWDSLFSYPFFVFLVLALYTKSAHFPFSSWLPEAMAAPTPVSALVHSSTLVTAGIYIFIRLLHLFPACFIFFLGLLGLWTLILASFCALGDFDSKKIVAFSTLSQLGLMSVALFMGKEYLSFFHLITHALFKASMFMVVGYFLLFKDHCQDCRSFNIPLFLFPFQFLVIFFCGMALSGFVYLSGFFSKECILEKNFFSLKSIFCFLLYSFFLLTGLYSLRLFFSFFKTPLGSFSKSLGNSPFSGFSFSSLWGLFFLVLTGGFYFYFYFLESSWGEGMFKGFVILIIVGPLLFFLCEGEGVLPSFKGFYGMLSLKFFNSSIYLRMLESSLLISSVFEKYMHFRLFLKVSFSESWKEEFFPSQKEKGFNSSALFCFLLLSICLFFL